MFINHTYNLTYINVSGKRYNDLIDASYLHKYSFKLLIDKTLNK